MQNISKGNHMSSIKNLLRELVGHRVVPRWPPDSRPNTFNMVVSVYVLTKY